VKFQFAFKRLLFFLSFVRWNSIIRDFLLSSIFSF
jgi:hypothetical protein